MYENICRIFLLIAFASFTLLVFGPWEGTPGEIMLEETANKVSGPLKYIYEGFFGRDEYSINKSEIDPHLHELPIETLIKRVQESADKAEANPSKENIIEAKELLYVTDFKIRKRGATINKNLLKTTLFFGFFGLLIAVILAIKKVGNFSIENLKQLSFWQATISIIVGAGVLKWLSPKNKQ